MRLLTNTTTGRGCPSQPRVPFLSRLDCRCAWRNRRRMRKACWALAGLFLFLFLLVFTSDDTLLCSPNGCHPRRRGVAPRKFADKSAFVSTLPQRRERRRPEPHDSSNNISSSSSSSSYKRIVRWTGFFFDRTWEGADDRYFAPCPETRCTMTNDRERLSEADAVLFHAHDLFNFWRGYHVPQHRFPHQVWILYNIEPLTRTPLNFAQWAHRFNWTAGYRLDTDVPVPYGGYARYSGGDRYGSNHSVNHASHKPRLAAWMASNCFDYNRRQLLVQRLKHLLGDDLDLYGGCNDKRCPVLNCEDTLSAYKFYLALENANCRDYVTEKFWSALVRQQVPVVLGGASSEDYRKIAPPNSFLHIDDFPSVEHLARHLRFLSQNETAYNRHLAWTRHYEVHSERPARRRWWCELCRALHDPSRPAQVYRDLEGWFQDDVCPQWTFASQVSRWIDGLKFKMGLL